MGLRRLEFCPSLSAESAFQVNFLRFDSGEDWDPSGIGIPEAWDRAGRVPLLRSPEPGGPWGPASFPSAALKGPVPLSRVLTGP